MILPDPREAKNNTLWTINVIQYACCNKIPLLPLSNMEKAFILVNCQIVHKTLSQIGLDFPRSNKQSRGWSNSLLISHYHSLHYQILYKQSLLIHLFNVARAYIPVLWKQTDPLDGPVVLQDEWHHVQGSSRFQLLQSWNDNPTHLVLSNGLLILSWLSCILVSS